jgi:AcrR family transcriptional regulator
VNSSTPEKRPYTSKRRTAAADDTRRRILDAARTLFGQRGIDPVTIADIGLGAGVAASTVYAAFKSKRGIIRALMETSLFGGPYQAAQKLLDGITDPVRLIALTARVARAVYEGEATDLGLLRTASGFSPELRAVEEEFESMRYAMQEERVRALFASGTARAGLSLEEARRVLWMYTSRDVYRMLVTDGGWTAQGYQDWLSQTLMEALVAPSARLTPAGGAEP